MQVHDELVFEVKKSKTKEYQEQIVSLMENTFNLSVPLIVEAESGNNCCLLYTSDAADE